MKTSNGTLVITLLQHNYTYKVDVGKILIEKVTINKSNLVTVNCRAPANSYGQSTKPFSMQHVESEPYPTRPVTFKLPWGLPHYLRWLHHTYGIAGHKTSYHRV